MNLKLRLSLLLAFATTPAGAAVIVGNSSLIDVLHYSDTFTFTANGGIAGRIDTQFPNSIDGGYNVENNYGNPSRVWTSGLWSLNSDTTAFPPANPAFPGGSGAGSDTGMTQTGFPGTRDFGIEYGLSDHYVVQFDAVQTEDRINITSSTERDIIGGGTNTAGQRGLTVFFRGDGHSTGFPNVSLFNSFAFESLAFELAPDGIGVSVGQWANYAVRFSQASNTIEIYVNEVSLGVVDLTTFAGGVYADWSNAAVSVGGRVLGGSSILWTDNFQVGTAVPEPAALALAGMASIGLWAARGRKGVRNFFFDRASRLFPRE